MAKSSRPNKADKEETSKEAESSQVKAAKVGMWQAVIVALITTVGAGFIGYFSANNKSGEQQKTEKPVVVVPLQNSNLVKKLPEESNEDLYELIKDISIFDLRQWKQTPDSLKNTRYSPANYTNYLHLRKTKPLDKIVIHYGTSGTAIDMRCITNAFEFYQKDKPTIHDSISYKEYALVVDIGAMPLNKEFLIVVEATYWNGFSSMNSEDASTYTDEEIHGLDELGLIVFFPESKPFKDYQFLDKKNGGNEDSYRGTQSFYADINKKFIYWSIKDRQPDHHYRLKWNW